MAWRGGNFSNDESRRRSNKSSECDYKTDSICLISFSGGSTGDGAVSTISGISSSFSSSISSSIGVN